MDHHKHLLLIIVIIISMMEATCQEVVFDEKGIGREMVLDESVRTIQFYREGWILSYPIVLLNERIPLILEFDEISRDISDFSYQIFHCNADWTKSELMEQEYLEGYFENQIDEVRPSFNTYTSYHHYRLQIPNEDVRPILSGNYIISVYRDYDPQQVVFTKRFMISESLTTIEANVHRPILSEYRDTGHEVDVRVKLGNYWINDPYGETVLSIFQNGIWDYEISGLAPLISDPGELVYDYQEENVFLAGNEFRMFNTRNTQVREEHIKSIEFLEYFHYELTADEANPAHLYFDRDDLNGKFFIEAVNTRDPATEADYVFVHFTLKMPFPVMNGDVYITGASTNWQFTESNRMEYDNDAGAYHATLFLKQGNHNYRYIVLPDEAESFDISEIEGSHYETNNEYLILFYHRPPGERYDKLIGHQVAHSN